MYRYEYVYKERCNSFDFTRSALVRDLPYDGEIRPKKDPETKVLWNVIVVLQHCIIIPCRDIPVGVAVRRYPLGIDGFSCVPYPHLADYERDIQKGHDRSHP